MSIRVRLAPSPTGTLHIGTARTALFNWLFAKSQHGKFLIRIEDTDKERSKHEYTENILEGLKWLGLKWDGQPHEQSKSIESHKEGIRALLDANLAYRCYATESELEEMREKQKARGVATKYDNRSRNLSIHDQKKFISEGRQAVIRFKIEDNKIINWNDLIRGNMNWNTSDLGGDMVIARRAPGNEIGDPLYNLAVVIDDNQMKISHVIRGEDHIANTAKQILLYEALGLTKPIFAHTPLILNHEGRKLSKRDGVTSITEFKEKGYLPNAMANYMTLLGWSVPEGQNEIFNLQDITGIFTLNRINKAGAKFDWEKLNWINSQILHNLPPEKLLEELNPLFEKEGWELPNNKWMLDLAALIGPSLTVTVDAIEQAKPFFKTPFLKEDAISQIKSKGSKESLEALLNELNKTPWDGINYDFAKDLLKISADSAGVKKGILMKSLRAVLLGEMNGPDLISAWSLLSRTGNDIKRIRNNISL